MGESNVTVEKSINFALRIIKLYHFLCDEKREYVLSKQILKSGTSIGANIAEAECGISRNDFLAKMYIALKECNETKYWLILLNRSGYIDSKAYSSIMADCEELFRLLSAITKTTRETKNGIRNGE